MKSILVKIIIFVFMASTLIAESSQKAFAKVGEESIRVYYREIVVVGDDNKAITTQKEPFIYENIIYLPIRTVAEGIGYKVSWEDENSTVYLETSNEILFRKQKTAKAFKYKNDELINNEKVGNYQKDIKVTYRDIRIIFEDKEVTIDNEPFIYGDIMYVAARSLGSVLEREIEWDDIYNIAKIKPKSSVHGLVFTVPEGCKLTEDLDGSFDCYLKNGMIFAVYYKGRSFENFKNEEYIKELEESLGKENKGDFSDVSTKLIDYRYMKFNEREYLVLDSECYDDGEDVFAKFPKTIIMEAKDGIIVANYMSYLGNSSKDLELFEELMFTAVLEQRNGRPL